MRAPLAEYLTASSRRFPGMWRAIEDWRARYSARWPSWCYMPALEVERILSRGRDSLSIDLAAEAPWLTTLATWRQTQGVYRVDPDLLDALWSTPLEQIPVDVLYHLPEWCVFVELPGREVKGERLLGAFAFLDWDERHSRADLLIEMPVEGEDIPLPVVLPLNRPTLTESIAAAHEMMLADLREMGHVGVNALEHGFLEHLPGPADIAPVVSVLLYLCSSAAEMRDARGERKRPENPQPRRVKGGLRLFAADRPTIWECGYRLGAALRRAEEREHSESAGGTHASPKPHVRRAHWHGFWTGPRAGKRRLDVRWMPPIAVNLDDADDLVPTIRTVRDERPEEP